MIYEKDTKIIDKYKKAEKLYKKSQKLLRKSDYINALKYLNQVLELNPKCRDACECKAFVCEYIQNIKNEISEINKTIEREPEHPVGYILRADTRVKLNDYRGAIADYTKVIKLEPENYFCYWFRAYYKYNIKDYNGAIEDYIKSKKLNPKETNFLDLARAKYRIKDYNGAIEDCIKTIELTPADSSFESDTTICEANKLLAVIYYKQKQINKSLEFINKNKIFNCSNRTLAYILAETCFLAYLIYKELNNSIESNKYYKYYKIASKITENFHLDDFKNFLKNK